MSGPVFPIVGKVVNPTFPRSGNSFLGILLHCYFKDRLRIRDEHNERERITVADANFLKNHDFHLKDPSAAALDPTRTEKYIVQYRHPLESLVSYYDFILKQNRQALERNSEQAWLAHYYENIDYWCRFVEKWVLSNHHLRKRLVPYSDLTQKTMETATEVIRFLTEKQPVDRERLHEAVSKYSTPKLRDVRDFQFFDERFFSRQERRLGKYLSRLGIPSIFDSRGQG